jgi:AcrR family transcriptional regulator
MDPTARRREILDHARDLFAERSYGDVTTADIARAAGVTRALVHHYCGGVHDIFLTVAAEFGATMASVRNHGLEMPFEERVAANCSAYLDVVEQNSHLWLAIMGQVIPDSDAVELLRAGIELNIERMINLHSDVLRDTPETRVCLRAYIGFMTIAVREWLGGRATREQTERLLTTMLISVVHEGVAAIESVP